MAGWVYMWLLEPTSWWFVCPYFHTCGRRSGVVVDWRTPHNVQTGLQTATFGMCFRTAKSGKVWNYFITSILGWPAPLLRWCAVETDCLAHLWISHLASVCLAHGWIEEGGGVFTLEFGGQSLPNGRACTGGNVLKCMQMCGNVCKFAIYFFPTFFCRGY